MPSVIDETERKQQAKLQISDEQSEAYPNSTSQGALKLDSLTEQRSTKVLTEEEVTRIRLEDQLVEQIIQDFFN
jgi:regulator of sigma D